MISLRLPLRDIAINQPFGVNYFDFYQKMGLPYHTGVDFRARDGCPCYAANGGEVTGAGTWSDGGIGVEITHPEGWATFYYHFKEQYLKMGGRVIAGDLIGLCDNTGKYTTGDHLHFELRDGGIKINPAGYFNFTYGGEQINPKDWNKSRCYHRYYRTAKRNLANEMKVALYMARRLKRLPSNEELNAAIWGGWDIEAIMNPSMYELWSQIGKVEYLEKHLIPFQ